MSSSKTLTDCEVAMIKGMLTIKPALTHQMILSHFTRPGRDLNHRVISEIANGSLHAHVRAASMPVVRAFMEAFINLPRPDASSFLAGGFGARPAKDVLRFQASWWGVGQGLFMSGRLQSHGTKDFNWIYDCGSSSSRLVLDNAISRFNVEYGRPSRIDLVAISHFDEDHINGIVSLIKGRKVGILLLPYLPAWQRVLIAVEQEIQGGSGLMDFLLDPAGYLVRLENTEIEEILLVPSAGPDDIAPSMSEDPDAPPIEPTVLLTGIDYGPSPEDEDGSTLNGKPVRYLKPGGRIVASMVWEFIPYNDAERLPKVDVEFRRRATFAARIMKTLPHSRKRALVFLKALYQRTFGKTAKSKNIISLFLYSGPVGLRHVLLASWATAPVRWSPDSSNYSLLSTGDGYLDTPVRLSALQRFYGRDKRIARAGIFQVMHHGAKANWHKGVADALQPAVSIFSSDPSRSTPGHPDSEVLRDFWAWRPVQVDGQTDFHLLGIVGFL